MSRARLPNGGHLGQAVGTPKTTHSSRAIPASKIYPSVIQSTLTSATVADPIPRSRIRPTDPPKVVDEIKTRTIPVVTVIGTGTETATADGGMIKSAAPAASVSALNIEACAVRETQTTPVHLHRLVTAHAHLVLHYLATVHRSGSRTFPFDSLIEAAERKAEGDDASSSYCAHKAEKSLFPIHAGLSFGGRNALSIYTS